MATHNKTLLLIASKLGLVEEDKVLRKAAEFERLLQTKTMSGSNMSDTSKVVICLDLAAFILGVEIDTKMAIKYSGLKPSTYTNSQKVVANLLELNSDKLTVPSLCVKLQCNGVQALAENILEKYRKHAKMELDLNLPQYVCMAVHQACRLNKVKIPKSKLLETSRLRPTQWSKLEVDWTKFVNENFASVKKRGRPVKSNVVDDVMEVDKPIKEESLTEPQIESYEDWKKRMLEAAYKELNELEALQKKQIKKQKRHEIEENKKSPRKLSVSRSPMKNSQSPQKSSQDASKKVILLFPCKDRRPSAQLSRNSPSRKLSQCLSPRKENHLSPRKDALLSPTQEDMSPRRSPRKTPQKYYPYNTPRGKIGVRLLFPKNS